MFCSGTRPAGHWLTRWTTAFGLALCLLATSGAARAEAAPQLPAQGVYDNCTPQKSADGCASRVQRLSAAGFTVVQNMGIVSQAANLPNILNYANTAHRYGVKVIWSVRPGISDVDLVAVVAALRVHPSTWGYYTSDEPGPSAHDELAAFSAKLKRLDPTHQQLIMGCGNCYGGEGSVDFMADIDATLGTDIYPVWEQAPDQPVVARKAAAAAAGLRKVADRAGRKTVVALQAFRWGDSHYDSIATGIGQASRFPTRREVEDQRNAAIAGGHPDLILWFTLNQVIGWEPGQRPWYWQEPADAAQRWSNLVKGAFAPLPNKAPVARFTARTRRTKSTSRAARSAPVRVAVDGKGSFDPDGRIVRYRWHTSGRRAPLCSRQRCSLRLRRGQVLKLVVTDSGGARASSVRQVR